MTSLLYHDVLSDPQNPSSGFSGADADIYKLPLAEFEQHLSAIAATGAEVFAGPVDALPAVVRRPRIVLLTFDDGGSSAWPVAADALGRHGWKGVFFVTTRRIGTPGFLTADAIRSLAADGHLVGSHSASHPTRMAALTPDELQREWAESRNRLEEILGSAVSYGSIPGGYYSDAVAEAAAESGYRLLFTSEPRRQPWSHREVLLSGRFSIVRHTPAGVATALARGEMLSCARQRALWTAKKLLKRVGGETWLEFRRRYWAWRAARRGPLGRG